MPLYDQEVLYDELARTGMKGQLFRSELIDRLEHLHVLALQVGLFSPLEGLGSLRGGNPS